jgi:diguanylate cyclase (GGDEF)-like protein
VVRRLRNNTDASQSGKDKAESGHKWPFFAAGIGLACVVGVADVATGYEINLGLFYLAPIAIAIWGAGVIGGLSLSLACVLGMFAVDNFVTRDIPFPSGDLIPYWNGMIRLGYFVAFTLVLSALRHAHARERFLARHDYLTGVANYHAFTEAARREIANAHQLRFPISIAYLDCDNFKAVNDGKGHHVGDELLRVAARNMTKHLRTFDVVARLGGDEFAILLPGAGVVMAGKAIRELRRELLATMAQRGWPVTFSIGVVTFLTPPANTDQALQITDRLMYAVKNNGKDQVLHQVYDKRSGLADAFAA